MEALLAAKARVEAVNKYGETPLHLASSLGLVEIAEVLLAQDEGHRVLWLV